MIWFGTVVLGWLVYAVLKSIPDRGTLLDLLMGLVESVIVAAPILGYVAYSRMTRPDGVLVWLRRFRGSYGKRIRFHRIIGAASSGMLYPVTVQDNSFKASVSFSALRLWILIPFWLFLWIIGVFVVAGLVFVASSSKPSVSSFLLATLVWTVVLSWATSKVLTRAGFISLPRNLSQARKEARRRLQAGLQGKRRSGSGVDVLKCEDEVLKDGNTQEIWKPVVSEVLSLADMAIIDVTDVSPNISWELSQVLTHLDKDRILLAVEEGSTTPDRLASKLRGLLTPSTGQAVTNEWVRAALFTYPAKQAPPSPRRRQQYDRATKQLRRELDRRMPD
jgi:hypothetical protein